MTLKLMPLGGVGETGALNCMLYETEKTAVIVDCGVGFANDRYPGVDIIIPNFEILEPLRQKLKAVILTHGHEDHVGALPFFLQRFPVPVYATEFTRGVIRSKLEEFNIRSIDVRDLHFGETVKVEDISIEPVYVNHSIMDVAALFIQAHNVKAFHCTDFKIDPHAPDQKVTDLERMKKIGAAGLDLLLLDSTSALVEGWTTSETKVRGHLLDVFKGIKGRIIACLFSSNSYRLQSLIECAKATNRKVALTGFSTKEYTRIATSIGRLDLDEVHLYDVEEMERFEDNEVLVIVTGSQAEPRSVLSRLSTESFGAFKIHEGDTLIMTSRMIPGNEGRILEMLNRVSMLGADVISEGEEPQIHASGHAREEELREIIKILKPKYFIPIHGEYRYLKTHAQIAQHEGVKEENTMVITNGDKVELTEKSLKLISEQDVGMTFISENRAHTMTLEAINRRRKLSWNGLVVISLLYKSKTKKLAMPPLIMSEGIFGGPTEAAIVGDLKRFVEGHCSVNGAMAKETVENFIKAGVRKYFKLQYDVRPEIIVLVHEV